MTKAPILKLILFIIHLSPIISENFMSKIGAKNTINKDEELAILALSIDK